MRNGEDLQANFETCRLLHLRSNYPRIFGGNAELRLDAMSTEALGEAAICFRAPPKEQSLVETLARHRIVFCALLAMKQRHGCVELLGIECVECSTPAGMDKTR